MILLLDELRSDGETYNLHCYTNAAPLGLWSLIDTCFYTDAVPLGLKRVLDTPDLR